jgi:hypothetical protein
MRRGSSWARALATTQASRACATGAAATVRTHDASPVAAAAMAQPFPCSREAAAARPLDLDGGAGFYVDLISTPETTYSSLIA